MKTKQITFTIDEELFFQIRAWLHNFYRKGISDSVKRGLANKKLNNPKK